MATYTYPGVYVQEIPSGVRTIAGVSTSDTAFIDFFARGPMEEAIRITGMEDFKRNFGGLHRDSEASYAINQFFLNGGQIAWVVRVAAGTPVAAEYTFQAGGSPTSGSMTVRAKSPGEWGKALQVGIDHVTRPGATDEFNLVVREIQKVDGQPQVVNTEIHRNVKLDTGATRFVREVVRADSELIEVTNVGPGPPPAETAPDVTSPDIVGDPEFVGADPNQPAFRHLGTGQSQAPSDGLPPDAAAFARGRTALEKITPNVFAILCIPAAANLAESTMQSVVQDTEKFCQDKRAFLIVDPHKDVDSIGDLNTWMGQFGVNMRDRNAALYFPRVEMLDPLNEMRPREVGPSGTMAGVYARTDATRGVWKAPAGTDARLVGVTLTEKLTDPENGGLNTFGINVLRTFPIFGNVAWGARTLDGADQQASEWKYVPVRRTALYLEESLYQGLKWAVFEPNDEPLWSQIRLNVGAFMHDLFRQGAFQGATPKQAYFVKCDGETTTQTDIDKGIVNILVGFAPLKPAEFVVLKIQQIAGQIET
jgi:phage tail sheath protein FI